MAKQYKVDMVSELVGTLKEKKNFILTHYSGVKVAELTKLRKEIRSTGAQYKVVKNNLFRKALKDSGYKVEDSHLKGPIGVVFANDEIGDIAKKLKDFKKDQETFEYFLGVIEDVVYEQTEISKIADLPSKEALLAQILSLVNGPAQGIAVGTSQIITSFARAVQAVGEKNG